MAQRAGESTEVYLERRRLEGPRIRERARQRFKLLPEGEKQRLRDRAADYHQKRVHGISFVERDEILRAQGGKCKICGKLDEKSMHGRLRTDHDHLTGKVRGLICHRCNLGIGLLGDSLEGVTRAVKYLQAIEMAEAAE